MADIYVRALNATYNKIICDEGIAADLYDYFTFEAPNADWIKRNAVKKAMQMGTTPKFKGWDGRIHLFTKKTHKLYAGLYERLETFASDRNLTVEYEYPIIDRILPVEEAKKFYESLHLPEQYNEVRYYQDDLFVYGVRKGRGLLLSPTASGKSLIIYLLLQYYLNQPKTLIVVPTINLVSQMANDFRDYGFDSDNMIHKIMEGTEKNSPKNIYVSTWQSIYEQPKEYFRQFRTIIVDEVHGADAKSLKGIMEKATLTLNRFGFTGTLKDTQCHRLVLEGLFGPIRQGATTAELIEAKYLAELNIKSIIFEYDQDTCKAVRKLDYPGEKDFLITHEGRNRFIRNLALSLKGNTILLYQKIIHGQLLYDAIKPLAKGRSVYLVYGKTPGEEREEIQRLLSQETDAIFIASYGTFSTGANIPSLANVIFGSPYKSRIKVLQSIGRGLRRIEGVKEEVIVYDLADDLTHKDHQNFVLKHYVERIKIYNEEKFKYRTYRISL